MGAEVKTHIEIHGFLLDHCGGDGSENYKQALAWITAALDEARAEGRREGLIHGVEKAVWEIDKTNASYATGVLAELRQRVNALMEEACCALFSAPVSPGPEVVEKEGTPSLKQVPSSFKEQSDPAEVDAFAAGIEASGEGVERMPFEGDTMNHEDVITCDAEKCQRVAKCYCTGCETWRRDEHECDCGTPFSGDPSPDGAK